MICLECLWGSQKGRTCLGKTYPHKFWCTINSSVKIWCPCRRPQSVRQLPWDPAYHHGQAWPPRAFSSFSVPRRILLIDSLFLPKAMTQRIWSYWRLFEGLEGFVLSWQTSACLLLFKDQIFSTFLVAVCVISIPGEPTKYTFRQSRSWHDGSGQKGHQDKLYQLSWFIRSTSNCERKTIYDTKCHVISYRVNIIVTSEAKVFIFLASSAR